MLKSGVKWAWDSSGAYTHITNGVEYVLNKIEEHKSLQAIAWVGLCYGTFWYLRQAATYERVIKRQPAYYTTKNCRLVLPPNLTEDGLYIRAAVEHTDLNIEETHHCSALNNVHMDGDLAQIQRDIIARQRNNVDATKSMGHVVMKEARKVATAKVARSIQDQSVI